VLGDAEDCTGQVALASELVHHPTEGRMLPIFTLIQRSDRPPR
jgi:hypothetical protein